MKRKEEKEKEKAQIGRRTTTYLSGAYQCHPDVVQQKSIQK